ncbi:MAG: glycosyltransferase family 4 protein [Gammaproteobacteria bacterium]
MKIALISDAWHPQINGVVTTLAKTSEALANQGHAVEMITSNRFRTWRCPGYPDVGLAFLCGPDLRKILEDFKPDAIHLATEGCIGFAARRYCLEKGYPFTTSFHTRFPEYFKLRIGLPLWLSYGYIRWFHCDSARILVATESLERELAGKGFDRLVRWSRGVDTGLFRPQDKSFIQDERPIWMYTGRVAIEKNIEDFLKLDLPGTKYVIGDGPQRHELQHKYPDARFPGYQTGENLARFMASADVSIFPSRTDTFGLVILEALASGVPVAAYPVPGPRDVLTDPRAGILDDDLKQAALKAIRLKPDDCRRYAMNYSWEESARQFAAHLEPISRRSDQRSFWPWYFRI